MRIPEDPPTTGLIDLSGRLSSQSTERLENYISSLKYNPKVIVLGESPADLKAFTLGLKDQWTITGDRLLMVVDIPARKVRMISGNALNNHGITGDFLNREATQNYFIPYMKRKDLEGAIKSSLGAVNSRFVQDQTTVPVQVIAPATPAPVIEINPLANGLFFTTIAVVLTGAGGFFLFKKAQNAYLAGELTGLRDELNQKATELAPLKGFEADKTWTEDYNSFFRSYQRFQDDNLKLATIKFNVTKQGELISSLLAQSKLLIVTAQSLLRDVDKIKKNATIKRPEPAGSLGAAQVIRKYETRSTRPSPKPSTQIKKPDPNQNTNTTIFISADQYVAPPAPTYSPPPRREPEPEPEPPKTSSDHGDSGSSSWESSSSSSWGDSGTSSWDSGSSSSDFGSGGGDW